MGKDKVKILHWIENSVNSIIPKVEAANRSDKMFTQNDFISIMEIVSSELKLHIRSKSESVCVLDFTGDTLGELSQAKVLIGKEAKPGMYEKMKSKYKFILTKDGLIEVSAFEHMVGLKKERLAFKEVLTYRLNLALDIINAYTRQ